MKTRPGPEHPARKYIGPRRSRGFTILELTVTLVLIGILAAVAIPRFVGGEAFSTRGFFDETRGLVRYAQKVAIAERRQVYVSVTANGVELCYVAGSPCPAASHVTSPTDASDPLGAHTDTGEGRWKLSGQLTLSATTANFSFHGLGQADSSSVITFTSSVADDPARTITVTANTGYVQP